MGKRIIVFGLLALMILGIAIAVANFISVQVHAAVPCIQVRYLPNVPDCYGNGVDCWDCTNPLPPKD